MPKHDAPVSTSDDALWGGLKERLATLDQARAAHRTALSASGVAHAAMDAAQAAVDEKKAELRDLLNNLGTAEVTGRVRSA